MPFQCKSLHESTVVRAVNLFVHYVHFFSLGFFFVRRFLGWMLWFYRIGFSNCNPRRLSWHFSWEDSSARGSVVDFSWQVSTDSDSIWHCFLPPPNIFLKALRILYRIHSAWKRFCQHGFTLTFWSGAVKCHTRFYKWNC